LEHRVNNTHRADRAGFIKISGSIQKYHPDYIPSGKFIFENIVQPATNTKYQVVG
jgi:hypothetical protein